MSNKLNADLVAVDRKDGLAFALVRPTPGGRRVVEIAVSGLTKPEFSSILRKVVDALDKEAEGEGAGPEAAPAQEV